MTFGGNSYIRYRLKESFDEPSRSISLALKTTEPEGTLVFAAGQYDYSILEVCTYTLNFTLQSVIDHSSSFIILVNAFTLKAFIPGVKEFNCGDKVNFHFCT